MYVVKVKALINFMVTAQLICRLVLAYAKNRFFHDAAHILKSMEYLPPENKFSFVSVTFGEFLIQLCC